MKIVSILKNTTGFTLVQAVFILVVLSLLGVVMMRMIGVQSSTSVFALQGARAYQAARSGLEWGAAQAAAGSCVPSTGPIDIESFSVTVECSPSSFTEGPQTYSVYSFRSVAEFGSYGTPDYIQRRLESKVKLP